MFDDELHDLTTDALQDSIDNMRGIIAKSNALKGNPCHDHEEEMRWLCRFFGEFAPLPLVELSLDLMVVSLEEIVLMRREDHERLCRQANNQ